MTIHNQNHANNQSRDWIETISISKFLRIWQSKIKKHTNIESKRHTEFFFKNILLESFFQWHFGPLALFLRVWYASFPPSLNRILNILASSTTTMYRNNTNWPSTHTHSWSLIRLFQIQSFRQYLAKYMDTRCWLAVIVYIIKHYTINQSMYPKLFSKSHHLKLKQLNFGWP